MSSALPVLVLSSLLFFSAASNAGTEPTPEAEVAGVIKAYDQAWGRKDAAAFEQILAADYVYFTSKGALWPRQRWLGLMLSPKYALGSAERSEIVVHRTADTAVVSSRWKGHGTYDNKPFRDDQRCSLVLARSAAGWKILSEHCTQIVAG